MVAAATLAAATAAVAPELDEADGLLARGDHRGALDAYRRVLERAPDGPAATRVLEILVSSAAHLDEADELAGEILTRQPEAPLPLLVRAVAAAEHGDPALAADTYEQIATIARRRNEDEDVIIARLAAAEQWLRADKTDRAYRLTEQVLATMPAHAARRDRAHSADAGRSPDRQGADRRGRPDLRIAAGAGDRRPDARSAGDRARAHATARARRRAGRAGGAARDPARQPRAATRWSCAPISASGRSAPTTPCRRSTSWRRARGAPATSAAAHRYEERVSRAAGPYAPGAPRAGRTSRAARPPPRRLTTARRTAGTTSAAPPARAPSASAEELERLLGTNPTDVAAAETLADIYARIAEPHERAEALSSLLRRALGLTPERRKAIYASVGESAEASGDLDRAEQAY